MSLRRTVKASALSAAACGSRGVGVSALPAGLQTGGGLSQHAEMNTGGAMLHSVHETGLYSMRGWGSVGFAAAKIEDYDKAKTEAERHVRLAIQSKCAVKVQRGEGAGPQASLHQRQRR